MQRSSPVGTCTVNCIYHILSLSAILGFSLFSVGRVDLCQMVLLRTLERYKVIVEVVCKSWCDVSCRLEQW